MLFGILTWIIDWLNFDNFENQFTCYVMITLHHDAKWYAGICDRDKINSTYVINKWITDYSSQGPSFRSLFPPLKIPDCNTREDTDKEKSKYDICTALCRALCTTLSTFCHAPRNIVEEHRVAATCSSISSQKSDSAR